MRFDLTPQRRSKIEYWDVQPSLRVLWIIFIFLLCIFLIGSTLIYAFDFHLLEPFSDWVTVLERWNRYRTGTLSFWRFIFNRVGSHPAVLIYSLSFLDLVAFKGHATLLMFASMAANLMYSAILCWMVVRFSRLSRAGNATLCLLVVGTTFSLLNAETWLMPWQALVATLQFLIASGLMLFAWGIDTGKQAPMIAAALILSLAVVSHGSGVALLPILFLGILAARGRGWWVLTIVLATFVAYTLSINPLTDEFATGPWVILKAFAPYSLYLRTTYVLGTAIASPVSQNLAIGLGILASLIFLASLIRLRRRLLSDPATLFFSLYGIFCLEATVLAVWLNMVRYYGQNTSADLTSFFANRYMPACFGFWICTSYLGVIALPKVRAFTLACVFVVSVISFTGRMYYLDHLYNLHVLQNHVWSADAVGLESALPLDIRVYAYGLPSSMRNTVDTYVEMDRRDSIGRYARPSIRPILGSKLDIGKGTLLVKPEKVDALGSGFCLKGHFNPKEHLGGFLPLVDSVGVVRGVAAMDDREDFTGYTRFNQPGELRLLVKKEGTSLIRKTIDFLGLGVCMLPRLRTIAWCRREM